MKKSRVFMILGFVVVLTLGQLTKFAQFVPVTTLTTTTRQNGQIFYSMITDAVYDENEQGLPDPEAAYSVPLSLTDFGDIYIVQESANNTLDLYVKVASEFWAYPSGDSNLIDWTGARIFYVVDRQLLASGIADRKTNIGDQIGAVVMSGSVSARPTLMTDGLFESPVFCVNESLDQCTFKLITTQLRGVSHEMFTEEEGQLYFTVKGGEVNGTVVDWAYVPVVFNELKMMSTCEVTSTADQFIPCLQ